MEDFTREWLWAIGAEQRANIGEVLAAALFPWPRDWSYDVPVDEVSGLVRCGERQVKGKQFLVISVEGVRAPSDESTQWG